jgi:hypothetical protein
MVGHKDTLAIGGSTCGEPVATLKGQLPRGNQPLVPPFRLLFSIILTPKAGFYKTKTNI